MVHYCPIWNWLDNGELCIFDKFGLIKLSVKEVQLATASKTLAMSFVFETPDQKFQRH